MKLAVWLTSCNGVGTPSSGGDGVETLARYEAARLHNFFRQGSNVSPIMGSPRVTRSIRHQKSSASSTKADIRTVSQTSSECAIKKLLDEASMKAGEKNATSQIALKGTGVSSTQRDSFNAFFCGHPCILSACAALIDPAGAKLDELCRCHVHSLVDNYYIDPI